MLLLTKCFCLDVAFRFCSAVLEPNLNLEREIFLEYLEYFKIFKIFLILEPNLNLEREIFLELYLAFED